MNTFTYLILVFPVIFMIHELEEMVLLPMWLKRNASMLKSKFLFVSKMIKTLENLSPTGFAIAVFEEFVIVLFSVALAFYLRWYYAWVALFTAFTFHLLVHIGQWIILRRYVPAVITSVLCLIYCGFTLYELIQIFSLTPLLYCFLGGMLFMVINLLFAHKLGHWFDKYRSLHTTAQN